MYEPSFNKDQIYDNRTAKSFLSEEKRWLGAQQRRKKEVKKFKGEVPIEGMQELAKALKLATGL